MSSPPPGTSPVSPRKPTDTPPQQPPSGNFGKPPGAAERSASGEQQQQQPAKKEVKPTTAENQYIITSLQSIVSNSSKSADTKIKKLADDVGKRFEPLYEKLSRNEVSPAVVQLLTQMCQSVLSGDSRTTGNVQVTLVQKHWEELGSGLVLGIKRLAEMTR
jgi:hypothetical protein